MLKHIIIVLFLFLAPVLLAQNNGIVFTQNVKQYPSNVLYKADLLGGLLFLESNCLTYVFNDEKKTILNAFTNHPHQSKSADSIVTTHSYKVHFVNKSEKCIIQASDQVEGYENYFIGKDKSKWSTKVKSFLRVTYSNLWDGIDLVMYQTGNNLKYDFVVHPGANPNQIKLRYEGIDSIKITQNNIVLKTAINDVIERKPVSYQYNTEGKDTVQTFYVLDDSKKTVSYRIYKYDHSRTLFIDPELVFSTYTGSKSDNWGFTATFDNDGNVYSGGIEYINVYDTRSLPNGYPVLLGAFQQTNKGGDCEIVIIKYDHTGSKRLYATYLGGSNAELPHSMVVNSKNELVLYGTTSSPDFPVVNAYDNSFNGGETIEYDNILFPGGLDLFVAKLSPDGSNLQASTFIGGSQNDGMNFNNSINPDLMRTGNGALYYNYGDGVRGEVIVDKSDNVYVGTSTYSTDFPIVGGFQSANRGKQEGVVMKLNASLSSLEWSSYFGGTDDDAIYSLDIDADNTVYVAGGTNSTNLKTTAGVLKPASLGGTADAFVAKIKSDGSAIESASYWGSSAYDQAYFVRVDKTKHIYLYGQTGASGNTLLINATYGQPNSGQFISKLSNTLDTVIWSTVFGTGVNQPNISPTAMSVDVCNRIYLAGAGREWPLDPIGYIYNPVTDLYRQGFDWSNVKGTKNMPLTADAYQTVTDGQDFYFMVMDDKASSLEYATFFGEQYDNGAWYYDKKTKLYSVTGCPEGGTDHVDGGTSRFDKVGRIYQSVCASCGSCDAFPTFPNPGAWSNHNNSGNCNNATLVFDIHRDQMQSNFSLVPTDNSCNPFLLDFKNTSVIVDTIKVQFVWDFGDGSPKSNIRSPQHLYDKAGKYLVTLTVKDNRSCNLVDSVKYPIEIIDTVGVTSLSTVSICHGDSIVLGKVFPSDPPATYVWTPTIKLSKNTDPNPYAKPDTTTTYKLVVKQSGCIKTFSQKVIVFNSAFKIEIQQLAGGSNNKVCYNSPARLKLKANEPAKMVVWAYDRSFKKPINTLIDSILDFTLVKDTMIYVKAQGKYCGNVANDSIYLKVVKPSLLKTSNDTLLCKGTSVSLNVKNDNPAVALTVKWTPTAIVQSGQGSNTVKVKPESTTIVTALGTSAEGCTVTKTFSISVDDLNIDSSSFKNISCYNTNDAAIKISAKGISPFTFMWNDGLNSNSRINLTEKTYIITVTDNAHCSKTDTFIVINPSQLIVNKTINNITCHQVCNGAFYTIAEGGSKPYKYKWNTTDTTSYLANKCKGTYLVTITDSRGCKASVNGIIGLTEKLPKLALTASDTQIYKTQKVVLTTITNAPDSISYHWMPEPSIEFPYRAITSARPDTTTTFFVIATDKYGCNAMDTITIFVKDFKCDIPNVYVPNAFSPNDDKVNDVLFVESKVVDSLYFAIYTRWGEKVFETTDITKGWDGSYKGEKLSSAVFVYYLDATCINRQRLKKKGNISLLR